MSEEGGQGSADLVGTTSRAAYAGYGHEVTAQDRAEWQEVMSARAQEAFRRGREAVECGVLEEGLFWLERAERMAGASPNVIWALGMALLQAERFEECLVRLDRLYERFGLREAAFLRCVCLVRLGRVEEAVAGLRAALARCRVLPDLVGFVSSVAGGTGGVGWCSLSNGGWVDVEAVGRVRVLLDGVCIGQGDEGRFVLPDGWQGARRLEVLAGRRHLVGSPIDVGALTRCESLVRVEDEGLEGWVWYPAEAEFVPSVRLWDGRCLEVSEMAVEVDSDVPLSRPRMFRLGKGVLPQGDVGPLMIWDGHGRALTGAPVDASLWTAGLKRFEPVSVRAWPMRAAVPRVSVGCVVVVPVYRDLKRTRACLQGVIATVPSDVEVIVVDDATPEPALACWLDELAAEGRMTLVRHGENRGFPVSANDGMRLARGRDVILLNSDTLVFSGWVERMRARMERSDIGTLTPFSNDASILSYPSVDDENAVPGRAEARAMDRLCQRLFGGAEVIVNLPTGNGFCMGITAECLAEVGFFREDVFGQGYGEENDFCLRASAAGFRHCVAPDVYVAHVGSASFGSSRKALMARNLEILNGLHPGYDGLVGEFVRADPLLGLRRRLDVERLVERGRSAVLLVQHDAGGGVGRAVRQRSERFAQDGLRTFGLRPSARGCVLEVLGEGMVSPNLRFDLPGELPLLVEVLRRFGVQRVEWHHLVGHAPCVRGLHEVLGVPYDVFLHDHVWFCPRISLLDGHGRYCGEPDLSGCEVCFSKWGGYLGEALSVRKLVERSGREFAAAERLLVPSRDMARRMQRHFPGVGFEVWPLEDDEALVRAHPSKRMRDKSVLTICAVGGIGQWKGYDVLLDLAQHIRAENLPVSLVLVGHTPDDEALIAAGIRVTGQYREEEAVELVRAQGADIGFISSIAPETWCYALGLLWRSNLEVLCFDIGAQAERVKRSGRGMVVPLGMPPAHLLRFILQHWSRWKE